MTSRRRRTRRALVATVCTIGLVGAACSDDEENADDELVTALADDDFPGDALDATCARLAAAGADDAVAQATAVLGQLLELGDDDVAIETMRQAVVDRCPEYADAVELAIAAQG